MLNRFFIVLICSFLFLFKGYTQSVLNPNDAVVTYNPNSPPIQPPYGQIGKWVRTKDLLWNTDSYKAYIYNGIAFRLKFPKSYKPFKNDGKKYPMLIMFHGLGEAGPITDNENQLYHLGQPESDAVDNGVFDGYLLYMQSPGYWGPGEYQAVADIIDYMVINNKLDPFRVNIHGLSAGGQGTWEMLLSHPTYIASALPMSNISIGYKDTSISNIVKFTPIWYFQGGQDGSPAPATAYQVRDAMLAAGADFKYTEFPTQGHDTWDSTEAEPDFFPFINRAYISNPWALNGRTEFCSQDSINITLGLPSGFDAYQWRKNGVIINGAISNTVQVNDTAIYDARVQRDSLWSDWSHTPVHVIVKTATITPPISVAGLMSAAIPSGDGKNYVNLQIPDNGYIGYVWKKMGSDSIIGNQRILTATQPGDYIASVTEEYGCSTTFSAPITVINATGSNAPDPAAGLIATTFGSTQVELNWTNNPKPLFNETAFEIYRSTTSGGPYIFLGKVPADTLHFTNTGLTPNLKYFYVVRAINENGAAPLSSEATATIQSDKIPPSIPGNLRILSVDRNSVNLLWDSATDNVGVSRYDVYVNGEKNYSTSQTSIIISGLKFGQEYSFFVEAKDSSGNYSSQSNQVDTVTILRGLHYKYYEKHFNRLPDFNKLIPVKTGVTNNVSIAEKNRLTQFAFLWEGFIHIPVAGTYRFSTYSDAGSKVWLGTYDSAAIALVNNDRAHTPKYANGTVDLQPGVYPIAIAYFQQTDNAVMSLYWTCTTLFNDNKRHLITDQYFNDSYSLSGTPPAFPTNVKAAATAYNKINISWVDTNNDETGFEVYRSTNLAGIFNIIATTDAGTKNFTDSALSAGAIYFYRVQAINQHGSSGFDPASISGLKYAYYEGTWTKLPNYNLIKPVKIGYLNNVSLSPENRSTKFAFKYDGVINITKNGTYTFSLTSDDGSNLFIGGVNDSLNKIIDNNYSKPGTQKSGSINLTKGTYPICITYFQDTGASKLLIYYQGPGLKKQLIPDSVFFNPQSCATTFSLPANPDAPLSVTVKALSSSKALLTWINKSTPANATANLIYRSTDDSLHFKLVSTLSAISTTYTDTELFANTHYYYHVAAIGPGGTSQNALAKGIKTLDTPPVITKIANRSVHYGMSDTIPITATDADNDVITFSTRNLPSFVSLANTSNTSALLLLNPALTDSGSYNNIYIIASDPYKGSDTTIFNLNVNNNFKPVLNSVTNYSINDNDTLFIPLSAYDEDTADVLEFNISNLPDSIFSLQTISNDSANLILRPNYASVGNYQVQVNVSDGNGGLSTKQFKLAIKDRVPQMNLINNVVVKNGQQLTVNIIAADDSEDHIKLSAINLPSFATLTDNGNGTGFITVNPPNGLIGTYPAIAVTATDGLDSSSSTIFDISVVDKNVTSVYLHFSDGNNTASKPWNNISGWPTAGSSFSNFIDDNNNPTNLSLTFLDGFEGVAASGMQPGNGAGIYPDVVMHTAEYESSDNSKTIEIAGLDTNKRYNFVFFNSHDNTLNGLTDFTINAQTVSLNAEYNINKTVQINNIKPDSTGQVLINVAKEAGADYAYISTIIIQSYDSTAATPLNPSDIRITDIKNNSISLQWQDRSDDETGFEIWRATDSAGQYSLLKTLAANTIAYTDSLLTENSTYYYVVRAFKDSIYSDYSNVASATTYAYNVYINFTAVNDAPTPWNNLNGGEPELGYTWNDFFDDTNIPTSIGMQVTNTWAGLMSAGMNTGNNSGAFPDNVMIDSYGLFPGQTGTLKITGLNLTMKYNFTFFASSQSNADVNVAYIVNGKTTKLNASLNTSATATLYNIVPDENGEVSISVTPGTPTSLFGLIGALIIHGYSPDTSGSLPKLPDSLINNNAGKNNNTQSSGTTIENKKISAAKIAVNKTVPKNIQLNAYPNPFHNYFTLNISSENKDNIQVQIFDMNGRIVYQKQFENINEGTTNIKIETDRNLVSGMYVVRAISLKNKNYYSIKIIKQ